MVLNCQLNYVEFPSKNLKATKTFFEKVFGWQFDNYGADYIAFSDQGLDGGFYTSNKSATTDEGGTLLVFHFNNLTKAQSLIEESGGIIVKSVFSFPVGSRFHFMEPGGNELAVWSKKALE